MMKTKLPIRMMIILIVVTLCFVGLSVAAHAYEKVFDPITLERLQKAQPDETVSLMVWRSYVEGESIYEMPSWPDLGAARKEFSAFVTEQNDLLISQMKQVADLEVRSQGLSVPCVMIDIAAGEVEKLEAVDEIAYIILYHNAIAEPATPADPSEGRLWGDSDMDDELTILDATHIQRYLAGLVDEARIDLSSADFDKDGEVTVLDATAIRRFLVGLPK